MVSAGVRQGDLQSPRISATQRIRPVLPARTTLGGDPWLDAFSVAGGDISPLTCVVVEAIADELSVLNDYRNERDRSFEVRGILTCTKYMSSGMEADGR
jgi:hypothetical protein